MVQDSRRLAVLCVAFTMFGAACGSTSAGGGGGGVTAEDAASAADIASGPHDTLVADTGCTATESSCTGNTLNLCVGGSFKTQKCDDAGCIGAGYLGSTGCGVDTDGLATCLCTPCSVADTVCLSTKEAQVCDLKTGKVSTTTCTGAKTCSAGKCATPTCTPKCTSGACGANSDGCGGTCTCSAGEQCNNGTCQKPCTTANNACTGDTLHTCGVDGFMHDKTCGVADCLSVGYVGYAECGANPGQAATCLCVGCTEADNKCADGTTVQTCDLASSKLTTSKCTGKNVCYGGSCVDPTCKPTCDGSKCGPNSDGCGGTCNCGGGDVCDAGTCKAACSDYDNFCIGSTLKYCGSDGLMATQTCSAASCIAAGYVAFDSCGMNSKFYDSCLCKTCTVADNTCLDSKTAQVCDATTGKVSPKVCTANQNCKAGACQTTCTTSADCTASQLCVTATGVCKEVSGAQYTLEIKWAAIVGNYGDTPDPFVSVFKNGTLICTAPELADTYSPFWFTTCPSSILLNSSDTLTFSMYDADAMFDDFIGTVEWSGSALISLLKAGGYSNGAIGSSGTTITFTLTAQ